MGRNNLGNYDDQKPSISSISKHPDHHHDQLPVTSRTHHLVQSLIRKKSVTSSLSKIIRRREVRMFIHAWFLLIRLFDSSYISLWYMLQDIGRVLFLTIICPENISKLFDRYVNWLSMFKEFLSHESNLAGIIDKRWYFQCSSVE